MLKSTNANPRPVIDLSGPAGNTLALLSIGKGFARQLDIDPDVLQRKMLKGDYENAIYVFEKYFGAYVDIIADDNLINSVTALNERDAITKNALDLTNDDELIDDWI